MKYVAFYDTNKYLNENRSVALCAANVTEYMIDIFSEDDELQIVCPARTRNRKGIYRSRKTAISDNTTLVMPFTFGAKTPVGRALAILYDLLWLFFYLTVHTKKNETVVVYHSLSTMLPIRLVKRLKSINLILEIREFYSDARQEYEEFGQNLEKLHEKEMKYFQIADKYIFPSEILNSIVNIKNKSYAIAPGIYKPEMVLEQQKWEDGKIHIVYAGTLRKSKGVYDAIDVVEKLPENYCVHILGSGDKERLDAVNNEIECVSGKSLANIIYEGELRGEEFIRFLQKCHIGLSPQNKDAGFNSTSFPSKILTYLSNGLDVVSVKIPAIETSPVGKYIHYYHGNDLDSLAETIVGIDVNNTVDKTKLLKNLDKELRNRIKQLIR